ncbi:energy transducer TonB [Burkholderia alba]|uniref:energy transducer TonB n=1 Tax=Burkholderia alba TaxID=2683677 RepID=UPI0038992711
MLARLFVPIALVGCTAPSPPDPTVNFIGAASTASNGIACHFRAPIYPASEMQYLHQGTVYVQYTVSKSGQITDVFVWKTSGYPLFDASAVEAIQKSECVVPATANADRYRLRVPVSFSPSNSLSDGVPPCPNSASSAGSSGNSIVRIECQ